MGQTCVLQYTAPPPSMPLRRMKGVVQRVKQFGGAFWFRGCLLLFLGCVAPCVEYFDAQLRPSNINAAKCRHVHAVCERQFAVHTGCHGSQLTEGRQQRRRRDPCRPDAFVTGAPQGILDVDLDCRVCRVQKKLVRFFVFAFLVQRPDAAESAANVTAIPAAEPVDSNASIGSVDEFVVHAQHAVDSQKLSKLHFNRYHRHEIGTCIGAGREERT